MKTLFLSFSLKGHTVVTVDPAAVRSRTLALVRHYRNADMLAVGALLAELIDPGDAGAAIASLVQLVSWALDDHPLDPDEWLDSVTRTLTKTDTTPWTED